MAVMTTLGLDDLELSIAEIAAMPSEVIESMLQAEGEIIKSGQSQTAAAMLQGPYSTGAVASAVKLNRPKKTVDGGTITITFSGTQHGTRIGEIAFINEYGKRNQPARPFIRTANEKYGDAATDAAAKVLDSYLKSKGL